MAEGESDQNILGTAHLEPPQRRWMLISKALGEGKPLDQALTLAQQCERFIESGGQFAEQHHS